MLEPDESTAALRLSDLRRAHPADTTLQNLLGVLRSKLEFCSQLPIYEYEAGTEGHERCAMAFRALAEIERQSFTDLLLCLRDHLDTAADRASSSGNASRETRRR